MPNEHRDFPIETAPKPHTRLYLKEGMFKIENNTVRGPQTGRLGQSPDMPSVEDILKRAKVHEFSEEMRGLEGKEVVQSLPSDSAARKKIPLANGLLWYFPNALAAVAELSRIGNEKHNPGEPLHHSRRKSADHADTIMRHLVDAGKIDPEDGVRHTTKVAWRALALLQEELERDLGLPLPRNAKAA